MQHMEDVNNFNRLAPLWAEQQAKAQQAAEDAAKLEAARAAQVQAHMNALAAAAGASPNAKLFRTPPVSPHNGPGQGGSPRMF